MLKCLGQCAVACEVLAIEREWRLVYSWRGGGQHDASGYGVYIDTVVTWTLAPLPNGGTRLTLEYSGFPAGSFASKAMSGGWQPARANPADRRRAPLKTGAAALYSSFVLSGAMWHGIKETRDRGP